MSEGTGGGLEASAHEGGGLACQTKNRAHRAWFQWDMDGAADRGGGESSGAVDA